MQLRDRKAQLASELHRLAELEQKALAAHDGSTLPSSGTSTSRTGLTSDWSTARSTYR